MEIDFSSEDGEPRYGFESCGASADAEGRVTFEVCGASLIVKQGPELGERLWASGMALASSSSARGARACPGSPWRSDTVAP